MPEKETLERVKEDSAKEKRRVRRQEKRARTDAHAAEDVHLLDSFDDDE